MLTFVYKLSKEFELKKKVDRITISMDKVTVLNYYYIIPFQLILHFFALYTLDSRQFRNSHQRCSVKIDALKNLKIICINDLPHGLSLIKLFAEDKSLLFVAHDISFSPKELNDDLNKINDWVF